MKLVPVTDKLPEEFLRQNIKADTIFQQAVRLTDLFSSGKAHSILHRAFIGETLSKVYLPLYKDGCGLYDAVTCERINEESVSKEGLGDTVPYSSSWEPSFLSTLCPNCGESMVGSTDTLVLECRNCQSCWQENDGHFQALRLESGCWT